MNEQETRDEDPQNPLSRRLYLVRPKDALLAKLGVRTDHPAASVTGIITPRLRYETWFEGWGRAWRSKAKSDFLASFIKYWSNPFAPAGVSSEFLAALQVPDDAERLFDLWWTLQERIDLIEIDPDWRPS
jgi:hypothetical protein